MSSWWGPRSPLPTRLGKCPPTLQPPSRNLARAVPLRGWRPGGGVSTIQSPSGGQAIRDGLPCGPVARPRGEFGKGPSGAGTAIRLDGRSDRFAIPGFADDPALVHRPVTRRLTVHQRGAFTCRPQAGRSNRGGPNPRGGTIRETSSDIRAVGNSRPAPVDMGHGTGGGGATARRADGTEPEGRAAGRPAARFQHAETRTCPDPDPAGTGRGE